MKTKVAVLYEYGKPLVIEEAELDLPEKGEVMVRIACCAICHSDIHSMQGEHGHHPLPAAGGHEIAGYVEETGEGVTYVKAGDPVIITLPAVGCGECFFCTLGQPSRCEGRKKGFTFGAPGRYVTSKGQRLTQLGGAVAGFAQYTTVGQQHVTKIPADMPMAQASLLACGVISGFCAVTNKAKVTPFSSVVVMGAGGVGLNAVQGAYFCGAYPIIAVDVLDKKLEAARLFGATYTVNAKTGKDPVARVRELTLGRGADYVFITVAGTGPLRQGWMMVGMAGMTVVIGHAGVESMTEFDATEFVGGKMMTGSAMGFVRPRVDLPRLIEIYKGGRLKLDELISNTYPLEQINEAIASTLAGEALRNIIVF
ncbi:MAG: alcohol dehydrogenase catalytic domain-containing protein [Dehalococcoidales bacterium]|nr:alcohol dehydrogenase catalytic domain-containing protein [Dehalococcoidales bacterium]